MTDTIDRVYRPLARRHPDLAIMIIGMLDRLDAAVSVLKLFKEENRNALKGVITTIGKMLTETWQKQGDSYFVLRDNPVALGHHFGLDQGYLAGQVALVVLL
jgi:hypothetical protein